MIKEAEKYEFLKKNSEWSIVLIAVQQDGWAIQYASDEPKNGKEVVMAAIQQNGEAIRWDSDSLKDNKEIVLVSVKKRVMLLLFIRRISNI